MKQPPHPGEDPTSIGNLLRHMGVCTADQITAAVNYLRSNPGKRLGEALVFLGFVKPEMVDLMIANQRAQRVGKTSDVAKYVQLAAQHIDRSPDLTSLEPLAKKVLEKIPRGGK